MSRHEVRMWTEYSNGTETHTLACDVEGCGWEIAITEATEAGAKRAAREHVELIATIKAKQENDERFQLERDEARQRVDELNEALNKVDAKYNKDVDRLIETVNDERQRVAELEQANNSLSDEVVFLDALQAAGVDNWEGYEIAQEMMKEESEQ